MDWLQIHVVYINEMIYRSFFAHNSNLIRYKVQGMDNRPLNLGLPEIYNRVIDENLDKDVWLFFVHEDYEIKCDLDHIAGLSPDVVYGSFGTRLQGDHPVGWGMHLCSNKDGSEPMSVGIEVAEPATVDVLDCQSVLVHTSLLRRFPALRFDEKLTFDLYAEDFCINAARRHGVEIKVFPLQFQHYSHGKVTERYYQGLRYLAEKYPDVGVAGPCSYIGGRTAELEKRYQYKIKALEG